MGVLVFWHTYLTGNTFFRVKIGGGMEITNISKSNEFYVIEHDDISTIQRRFVFSAADNPMSTNEETIIALCDKLYPSYTTGE